LLWERELKVVVELLIVVGGGGRVEVDPRGLRTPFQAPSTRGGGQVLEIHLELLFNITTARAKRARESSPLSEASLFEPSPSSLLANVVCTKGGD
jgi:hypothetical protein